MDPNVILREFRKSDGPELEEILYLNGQFDYPEIAGISAMWRVAACDAAIFIVSVIEDQACGLIRGVYDGSRAMVHLLSVHPDVQHQSIGSALVEAFRKESKMRGAASLGVTTIEQSEGFWRKQGFDTLPVFLMLQNPI